MISIAEFARDGLTFPFGLDLDRTVAAIQKFAETIREGSVLLLAVEVKSTGLPDDFAHSSLTFKFIDRKAAGTETGIAKAPAPDREVSGE